MEFCDTRTVSIGCLENTQYGIAYKVIMSGYNDMGSRLENGKICNNNMRGAKHLRLEDGKIYNNNMHGAKNIKKTHVPK